MNNIGHVQVSLGRLPDALAIFGEAVRACMRLGDRTELGWQLENAGSVHRDKGEYDAALEMYRKARYAISRAGTPVS